MEDALAQRYAPQGAARLPVLVELPTGEGPPHGHGLPVDVAARECEPLLRAQAGTGREDDKRSPRPQLPRRRPRSPPTTGRGGSRRAAAAGWERAWPRAPRAPSPASHVQSACWSLCPRGLRSGWTEAAYARASRTWRRRRALGMWRAFKRSSGTTAGLSPEDRIVNPREERFTAPAHELGPRVLGMITLVGPAE